MSINSMTNIAVARRTDVPRPAPRTIEEMAEAARTPAVPTDQITAALAVITTYIPTEILVLYVAVLAALQNPATTSAAGTWATFWVFLIATPLVVWILYATKLKAAAMPLPLAPKLWPGWEMGASLISYIAWALSLPNAPFLQSLGLPASLGSIIVLVTSVALGLLAPLFQRPITP